MLRVPNVTSTMKALHSVLSTLVVVLLVAGQLPVAALALPPAPAGGERAGCSCSCGADCACGPGCCDGAAQHEQQHSRASGSTAPLQLQRAAAWQSQRGCGRGSDAIPPATTHRDLLAVVTWSLVSNATRPPVVLPAQAQVALGAAGDLSSPGPRGPPLQFLLYQP